MAPRPLWLPFRSKKPNQATTYVQSEKGSPFPDSQEALDHVVAEEPTPTEPKRDYSNEWGYGWGVGMVKEEAAEEHSGGSTSSAETPDGRFSPHSSPDRPSISHQSSPNSDGYGPATRSGLHGSDASSSLDSSALDRVVNDVETLREKPGTGPRLEDLRNQMAKDNLDYYVVPSEDAHGSERVAAYDKRREWISGFTGTAGQAIISKTAAYLVTDSRYWVQAANQLDSNWHCIQAGHVDGPEDWIEWLADRASDSRIGIDARMLSHTKATELNNRLSPKGSKLVHPPKNLIDLIWKDKPSRLKEPVFIHPIEFTGKSTLDKLADIRTWIREAPHTTTSRSRSAPTASEHHVATLITALDSIGEWPHDLSNIVWKTHRSVAYILNLRGQDIPFNPVFHSYLMITLDRTILFVDPAKLTGDVEDYLEGLGVDTRGYYDFWSYLKEREWGEDRVIITPETSHSIALMLTRSRCTVIPSYVNSMKAIKNDTEIDGMRRAYLRDGIAFAKFLAWLEDKISKGYEITEYEAAFRLTEYRRMDEHFMGLAYETISASGPNAAFPRYSPAESTAVTIDRETPYLNDSGAHYRDGTCDTARTWIFGRPTTDQCEAYTRVLQGHIAIDSAIFPMGTSGHQLGVLARKPLWQEGMDYNHETGHGVGSFLSIHEGPLSFSSDVTLVPGHVITNGPGFYLPGKWGIRIESALVVRRVRTKHEYNGERWLGFERLTCVPIQTKMIKDGMLSKGEEQWVKDHNRQCLEELEPYLRDEKMALKWLKRQASRGLDIIPTGPRGIGINRV